MSEFKLWSDINPEAAKELKPDFGLRNWGDLDDDEAESMRHHLDNIWTKPAIACAIYELDNLHIAQNYAPNYRVDRVIAAAYHDFISIFSNQSEAVVLELLSIYARGRINTTSNIKSPVTNAMLGYAPNPRTEEQKDYDKWNKFDIFSDNLNKTFESFRVNITLTRAGFALRQEKKIETEIYEPVLKKLSDPKWKPVNEKLADAFKDYREKDYSSSVTHGVATVQAFLQILVNEKIGQGSITDLLIEAQKKELIPNDSFSSTILKDIEKVFARERQAVGNAHPTTEKATAKHARLILNLAMVFFEHCL